jgi:hypothetical protein
MAVFTTIDNPELYFQTKLYTGNGGTQSITFDGSENMQPDFVWLKSRGGEGHVLFDSVRGVDKAIKSESNVAQNTGNCLQSFDSDGFGFTNGSDGNSVHSAYNSYCSWSWKAGTTSIPSGSTTDPAGVSINTTSGFGIYKITAPSSGNYVLKHGLGTTPSMVFVKRTDGTQKWMVWHNSFSNATDDYLSLNSNSAKATYSTCWGTMNSTDCTIATGGTLDINAEHIIYVFTERLGFSRISSYSGNGNSNGTFINTMMKPAWVMVKGDRADNWQIMDNKRLGYNVISPRLEASTTSGEYTNLTNCDFTAQGFKIRSDDTHLNHSGTKYFYICFAEAPLVNSKGVPNNAR